MYKEETSRPSLDTWFRTGVVFGGIYVFHLLTAPVRVIDGYNTMDRADRLVCAYIACWAIGPLFGPFLVEWITSSQIVELVRRDWKPMLGGIGFVIITIPIGLWYHK